MAKKEEMGNVPNLRFKGFERRWETLEIGNILRIGSGKDYKHLLPGNIPVFGTGGQMTTVNAFLYDGESVFIGRKGTINKPSYFNGKFWTVDTLFYTHSFKNVLPKFVLYLFENINWLNFNEASGVPSLSKSTIEKIEINIPNITEQEKICKTISLIDTRIQTQIKIIEELKCLKHSVSKDVFSHKIKVKDDNGLYFPDWITISLDSICEIKKGVQFSKENLEEYGSYPCLNGGVSPSGFSDKYNTNEDTITISEGGNSCGYVNFMKTKFWLGGHCYKIFNLKNLELTYLYQLLKFNERNIMSLRVGSGLPNIQLKDLKEFEIKISKIRKEQRKIAELLSNIDSKIEIEVQFLNKLDEQKKYLLSNLFI